MNLFIFMFACAYKTVTPLEIIHTSTSNDVPQTQQTHAVNQQSVEKDSELVLWFGDVIALDEESPIKEVTLQCSSGIHTTKITYGDNFLEQEGKRVHIGKTPIAVFKEHNYQEECTIVIPVNKMEFGPFVQRHSAGLFCNLPGEDSSLNCTHLSEMQLEVCGMEKDHINNSFCFAEQEDVSEG